MESLEVHMLRSQGLNLLEKEGFDEPDVDRIVRFRSAHWDYLATGRGYDARS